MTTRQVLVKLRGKLSTRFYRGSIGAISFLIVAGAAIFVWPTLTKALTITDGMEAGWELGQPNFTTGLDLTDANFGAVQPPTASSMYFPGGVAFDPIQKTLFVADANNNRILVYLNTVPGAGFNNRPADRVLGQVDFTSSAQNTICGGGSSGTINACGLFGPSALWFDGVNNRLWVSDVMNYRVLGLNLPTNHSSIANGAAWTYVLGQPNFVSATINNPCGGGVGGNNTSTNSCGFDYPLGVSGGAGHLFVADNDNRRVLIFDTATITNGQAAVGVLGKPNFFTRDLQTTQAGLGLVCDVDFNVAKSRLYVADCSNNRVMVWEGFNPASFSDGAPASKVLGQPDFTTASVNTACGGGSNGSTNACGLSGSGGVGFDTANNRLFLSDTGNSRVLVFDDTALTNGQAAINVLGQPNLTTGFDAYNANPASSSVSKSLMRGVDDVVYDSSADNLYVADGFNHRVMVYGSHVGDYPVSVSGGVATVSGNTASITSAGGNPFSVVFPDGTTAAVSSSAITVTVGDGGGTAPSIIVNADLHGLTKTVTMKWYANHDLCVKDVANATITTQGSCIGGVLVPRVWFDTLNECANWKIGGTVCHVGSNIVITGLQHTALSYMQDSDNDGVNDGSDLCPNTNLSGPIPTLYLRYGNMGDNKTISGCNASQILACKGGTNSDERKYGINPYTQLYFSLHLYWAKDTRPADGIPDCLQAYTMFGN